MILPKIILKTGKIEAVKRFHPWIFSGAIKRIEGNVNDGDIVEVFSNHGEYLATGHYQNGSIAVRIFSFKQIIPDINFWESKISEAYNLRKNIGLINNKETNAYRLVFAEGDGLPGLIIDYYNGTAVIQCHSIGMYNIIDDISEILKDIYKNNIISIYNKSENSLPFRDNNIFKNNFTYGDTTNTIIQENGLNFSIDFIESQKTGFFIDQRDNRALLGKYSESKKVLNLFSYTGAFSIYAAANKAKLVNSVDSSAKAIEMASKNFTINNLSTEHNEFQFDALEFLKNTEDLYDIIIVDPPAYAKHNDARHHAIQGYKRLNYEAIKKTKKGGLIFTFSCSQVIDRQMFNSTITAAAIQSGRKISVLHQLSQPADHPFSIYHPEGMYLKGLIIQID